MTVYLSYFSELFSNKEESEIEERKQNVLNFASGADMGILKANNFWGWFSESTKLPNCVQETIISVKFGPTLLSLILRAYEQSRDSQTCWAPSVGSENSRPNDTWIISFT